LKCQVPDKLRRIFKKQCIFLKMMELTMNTHFMSLTSLKVFAKKTVVFVSLASAAFAATAVTLDFSATYKGGTTSCGTTYKIKGKEPLSTSRKPVFIYMAGTSEAYDNVTAMAAVQGMAERGYVAATVQYASSVFGHCGAVTGKAKCIFDPSSATSAVKAICSRLTADCSKGIVVGGFSQGSVMAIVAKNYDDRVRAAWGMGAHDAYTALFNDIGQCVAPSTRTLPASRLRIVNGEKDTYGGGTQDKVRTSSQNVTGYSCTGTSCLQADGSGWSLVLNTDVQDGSADHCYSRGNGCLNNTNDGNWATGPADWALKANLDWLKQFATP
jgi:hypothetical protein